MPSARSHLARNWLPIVSLMVVLLALLLMSNATENSARFGELYSWLLLFSALSLLLLTALIGRSLYRLLNSFRKREPGARLSLRLVLLFIVISAVPLSVVYYFSLQFLQRGIDSWFNVEVEHALTDALELSRASLTLRMREVLKQTERMAEELPDVPESGLALRLGELLDESESTEITLFGTSGRIVATANFDSSVILPSQPPEIVLLQVRQGHHYISLDPIRDVGFYIRAAVQVPHRDPNQEAMILQALYPIPARLSQLADSVQTAFDRYRELVFLRTPLKTSFILTLSLVLLFGILTALWGALRAARQLVAPIRDLAQGTQAVAAGRYDQRLPAGRSDELGFLVDSFNQMTRNLAQARDQSERSQQLVEQQRAYLEVVLSRLSSGVITLDHDGLLYTYNAAAAQILGVRLDDPDEEQAKHSRRFFDAIKPHLDTPGDWRQEITLFSSSGRQVLMCRGSSLPDTVGLQGGHVIVFDDITTLVQAQRDAAWGEVARRLAHEIKNPLTPIQLAAERIRRKYLKNLAPDQTQVLDSGTHTIVQQVQAMKDMVDAFNDYARAPQLHPIKLSINELITEVLYLYRDYPTALDIELDLDPKQPLIKADSGRMRQLLHNLVKNSIEALGEDCGSKIWITTRECHDGVTDYVELSVLDNGPGFPAGILGNIFEPYVTTKPKGTGLGLAIVKKIVEEHGGLIELGQCPQGGAQVIIRLPIYSAETDPEHLTVCENIS